MELISLFNLTPSWILIFVLCFDFSESTEEINLEVTRRYFVVDVPGDEVSLQFKKENKKYRYRLRNTIVLVNGEQLVSQRGWRCKFNEISDDIGEEILTSAQKVTKNNRNGNQGK